MSNHRKIKCISSAHQNLPEKVREVQDRFCHLQAAIKEGRHDDVALLEAQFSQNLREWQAELAAPSPESSHLTGGMSQEEIAELAARLFKDEEDDATSSLKEHPAPKPEDFAQNLCPPEHLEWTPEDFCLSPLNGNFSFGFEDVGNNTDTQGQQLQYAFQGCDPIINTTPDFHDQNLSNLDIIDSINSESFPELDNISSINLHSSEEFENFTEFTTPTYVPVPPSAFLGPKCALWDCARPAHGSEWYLDYCSNYHGTLAINEDSPGTKPVLRRGGISLKDNILIDALRAKTQGKNVGIPVCEGAVNTKCPWNASELFHLELAEGETLREWLFFDKPKRAYDSGNRKQRSLPDYNGRGWHESRKQLMKDQEGQKRSYYMDPQPPGPFEWHLFEYQINESDECALYRLELKVGNGKKTPKVKVSKDPLADLQKKMGQFKVASDNPSPPTKGVTKDTTTPK